MIEEHFPEFYRRCDEMSLRWQRRYVWSQVVQLGALLACAVASAIGRRPWWVVCFFGLAFVAQFDRSTNRSDEKWWNGRAGAESVKTMSWRFVVAGAPFSLANSDAEVELAGRIVEVGREVAVSLPVPTAGSHVTWEMRAARARPLDERVELYRTERIMDQCRWYTTKSELNGRHATWWSAVSLAVTGLGLALGVVAAVHHWRFDAVGALAAAGSALVAWMAVKQFATLARSYAVASNELAAIDVRLGSRAWTETEWAEFVDDAEEAISREHTSWRASRSS